MLFRTNVMIEIRCDLESETAFSAPGVGHRGHRGRPRCFPVEKTAPGVCCPRCWAGPRGFAPCWGFAPGVDGFAPGVGLRDLEKKREPTHGQRT